MLNLKTQNWTLENVETVIFDKDGTFVDLHYFWGKMTELRCKEIINKFSLSDDFLNDLCFGLGYDLNKQKMLPDGITALYSRTKIISLFSQYLINFNVNISEQKLTEIFDYVNTTFYQNITQYIKPIPEAIEFIEKLHKKGIKLGIVTSDSIVSTNLTLEYLNLQNTFKTVVGRESSIETKESGALTKIALQELNANPKTTIMIGDAPMDYFSAKNANVENTILVSTGQVSIKQLNEFSKYTINSLNEITLY